ncbi:gag-pol [Trichonephila clavipes]|nr:gag-pol [Trichonephila clavipes]
MEIQTPFREYRPKSCKSCFRVKKKFGMIDLVICQIITPSTSESDSWNDESIRKDQLADPEIKPIIEFKESSDEKPCWKDITPFHPTIAFLGFGGLSPSKKWCFI